MTEGVHYATERFVRDPADLRAAPEAPLADVLPGAGASGAPLAYTPTPFAFCDPALIARRQFIYGRHLTRQFLSATVAPGGVGKSSLVLVEAVAMAAGRDLIGVKPTKPLRVWYVNLEDPREEIERRVAAICLSYQVAPREIDGRLFFDGREIEIILATQSKSGAIIAAPVVDALTAALKDGRFDVLTLDPFVSAHRVTENDNGAIDAVVKALGRIAGAANCAIELVHHVRKTGGAEVTAEDARGAGAMVASARHVRVLNRMTTDEAQKAGLDAEMRRRTFRAEADKANLAPPEKARWFQLQSVPLGNGSGGNIDDQDYVAVVGAWEWPNAFDGVNVSDLRRVQTIVDGGSYRESPQAEEWVGRAVAAALNLDLDDVSHRAKIKALLKTWFKNGMLRTVTRDDEARRPRKFVEVGQWATD